MNKHIEGIRSDYLHKTKTSMRLNKEAAHYMPGGDTRTATYFEPYPLFMERGDGCYLYDADGNRYLDILGNYTSLVHGHACDQVVRAINEQAGKGTVFGAAADTQIEHARHLCNRVKSLDKIRYCNSGTEATLFAVRAARAYTGRDKIIKIDGGYHGTHDLAELDFHQDVHTEGRLKPVIGRGLPQSLADDVLAVPYNDLGSMEKILEETKGEAAAILVEPVLGAGGVVPAESGYLNGLRELADAFGVLLIFDEIITLRFDYGGMQALTGVTPDLTCLGKIIGGGLPVGAFGGKAEIMAIFDPSKPGALWHSGTFNGAPLVLAAGLATLEALDRPAIERINGLGDRLRQGFQTAFEEAGLLGQITSLGSLTQIHWMNRRPGNARETVLGARAAGDLPALLHMEMLNQGIYSARRGMYVISTPMTENHIDETIRSFGRSLQKLRPVVLEAAPHLIA